MTRNNTLPLIILCEKCGESCHIHSAIFSVVASHGSPLDNGLSLRNGQCLECSASPDFGYSHFPHRQYISLGIHSTCATLGNSILGLMAATSVMGLWQTSQIFDSLFIG